MAHGKAYAFCEVDGTTPSLANNNENREALQVQLTSRAAAGAVGGGGDFGIHLPPYSAAGLEFE